jgi:hypothetical protein
MNQTMRQQFSIPKPDDRFAADMLHHVAEKYGAPQCANLKVKVAHCGTREGWMRVRSLAKEALDKKKLEKEYTKAPETDSSDNWEKINLNLFQAVKQNTHTGQMVSASEDERREQMVEHGLGDELADALSPFDATIFVNDRNVNLASQAGQMFPLHGPITHECIHIIERRTGQHIISGFNPQQYHDPVSLAVLQEFIAKIGRDEFKHRYLTGPETSQDKSKC